MILKRLTDAQEGGKNVKRDHATSVGLLLNDLCGLEGTQVTRYHSLDTMISKIKYMVANTPPEQRESMWRVGDRPLCNSFVCPCCGRVRASMAAGRAGTQPYPHFAWLLL